MAKKRANGDPKKKKAVAKKKPTPKAGTNVGSQMTAKQKAAFKKKRGIVLGKTKSGNITGPGATRQQRNADIAKKIRRSQ
jgi:hypothetical protein